MQPLVIDIYHGDAVQDFARVKAAGIIGVIHKASQGGAVVDRAYASRRKLALAAGLKWGAYHFFDFSALAVRIGTSGDIKYAAIQEFGGTIPPHEIVPDKAKALAFAVGGKQVFAARVNLPAVTLPERSYLRASLAEMAGEIGEGLSGAVAEAME
jgi:hypothetical protein